MRYTCITYVKHVKNVGDLTYICSYRTYATRVLNVCSKFHTYVYQTHGFFYVSFACHVYIFLKLNVLEYFPIFQFIHCTSHLAV